VTFWIVCINPGWWIPSRFKKRLIKQNPFNLTPVNLALKDGSARTESFTFYNPPPKKASSVKQADLRDRFKNACRDVYTSNNMASPYPLSSASSNSSSVKTPENKERALMNRNWRYPKLPVVTLLLIKGVKVVNTVICHRCTENNFVRTECHGRLYKCLEFQFTAKI